MTLSSKKQFKNAASKSKKPKLGALKPFSVRFSDEERAFLDRKAGRKPLGTYIRDELLGDQQAKRKTTLPVPKIDYVMLARILGTLGRSELASNICLLATAAETGALFVDEETKAEIFAARSDIQEMRILLIKGLGLKPESE